MWQDQFDKSFSKGIAALFVSIILLVAAIRIRKYVRDPLRDIPGPLAARYTRLWELCAVWRGKFEQEHIELHNKYGKIVRLAPRKDGNAIDIPQWVQYYAFDVIGQITVGQVFGCMEQGGDVGGILQAIHDSMVYGALVGIVPELHRWLVLFTWILKLPIPADKVIRFIDTNLSIRKTGKQEGSGHDFLTKLLNLRTSGKVDQLDIMNTLGANVGAGSDTTAISISSVIYYMAKNIEATQKLRQEIVEQDKQGKLSDPITYRESQNMPYLQAVIKEALRVHPAVGLLMVRVVPEGGMTIADRYFPGGTEVGTSPWVVHFDKEVWGDDAHTFRPERWLENEANLSLMEATLMAFGAGARTCLGKNISMLEMSKLIPELYRKFDFELEDAKVEWKTDNKWFVKPQFKVYVKPLSGEKTEGIL